MANKVGGSGVPDSTNILENLTAVVDSVANVAKMLIKNSVTFFVGARLIKPCLHFMSMLTLRVSIFFITNSIKFPIINAGAKTMPKLTSSLMLIIGSIQAIHDRLESVRMGKTRRKIKRMGKLLEHLIFTFSGRGYHEKYGDYMLLDMIRSFGVLKIMPKILLYVSDILSFVSNKIIPNILVIGGIKGKKIRGAFNNVSLIIEGSVYLLVSKRKYGKNIISRIFKLGKTFIMLAAVLLATNAILWFVATKMIPNLKNMKISKRRMRRKFFLLFDMLHYAIGMFDTDFELEYNGKTVKSPAFYMSSIPISAIIKFGVKIAIAMSVLFYISLLLTPIGLLGPAVMLGALSIAAVTIIMGFALSKLTEFTVDVTLVKTLTDVISMILTTWAAKKIAEMAAGVSNLGMAVVQGIMIIGLSLISMSIFMNMIDSINGEMTTTDKLKSILDCMIMVLNAWTASTIAAMAAGVAALGFSVVQGIIIIGLSLISMSFFLNIINSINEEVSATDKLKSILDCMIMVLEAWAAKKIAETAAGIANLGFKSVLSGILIIGASLIAMTLILRVLNKLTEKIKNTDRVKLIVDSIVMVLTAWAAKKIAQMAVEVSNMGWKVLFGLLIIGSTLIMFTLILLTIDRMMKKKAGILISMMILSFVAIITPVMFFFLALALPVAPLALATSIILLAIAGIFALIGLMWKYVAKGALVTILLGLALDMFAPGFILFAIGAAIIGAHFKEVMLGILALVAIVAIIIGLGFAVEFVFMGAIAMVLVGVALTALAFPLLLIATSLLILSKVNITDKDGLKNIFKYLGGGLQELADNDAFSVKNLFKAVFKMGMIASISLSLGVMARVLKSIASLSIPTEFDEKGRGKNFVKMQNKDFVDASINATTIASIFVAMFDKNAASKLGIKGIKTIDLDALKNIKLKTVIRFKELSSIVNSIGNMAEVLQNVASLRIPETWDENGKPKTFRQMVDTDFSTASDNVVLIVTKLAAVLASDDLAKAVDKFGILGASTVGKLMESMGSVKDIVDVVMGLAEGRYVIAFNKETGEPTEWGSFEEIMKGNKTQVITDNIVSIISTLVNGMSAAFEDKSWWNMKGLKDKCETLSQISGPIGEIMTAYSKLGEKGLGEFFEKNMTVATESTGKFLSKLNSIDVNKLDKMAVISSNMAKFATSINGNFDALADALNEKLVKAMEQLNLTLDQIREVLDEVNGSLTESTESITKAVETKNTTDQAAADDKNKKVDPEVRKALEKIQKILSQEGISIKNDKYDPMWVRWQQM